MEVGLNVFSAQLNGKSSSVWNEFLNIWNKIKPLADEVFTDANETPPNLVGIQKLVSQLDPLINGKGGLKDLVAQLGSVVNDPDFSSLGARWGNCLSAIKGICLSSTSNNQADLKSDLNTLNGLMVETFQDILQG